MSLPRVLSYPPRHPYVDRLHGQAANLVYRAGLPRDPHRRYDPAWLVEHSDRIDIAHIHIGHDDRSVDDLLEVAEALDACNVPIVATVHDIQPPSGLPTIEATGLHGIGLRAQRLITLTAGAADEVEVRIGIRPQVIPHGPVLDSGRIQRARRQRAMYVREDLPVLLHAGHVNPNLDWQSVIDAARRTRGRRRVRILVHQQEADRILQAVTGLAFVEVVLLEGLSQGQLVAELAAAHCVVLPYRWATHSGLLELAADIGVPVVATAVGYLHQQHPVVSVPLVGGSADVGQLVRALDKAPQLGVRSELHDRDRALASFLHGHQRVYGSLMTCQGLPLPRRQVMARS